MAAGVGAGAEAGAGAGEIESILPEVARWVRIPEDKPGADKTTAGIRDIAAGREVGAIVGVGILSVLFAGLVWEGGNQKKITRRPSETPTRTVGVAGTVVAMRTLALWAVLVKEAHILKVFAQHVHLRIVSEVYSYVI